MNATFVPAPLATREPWPGWQGGGLLAYCRGLWRRFVAAAPSDRRPCPGHSTRGLSLHQLKDIGAPPWLQSQAVARQAAEMRRLQGPHC